MVNASGISSQSTPDRAEPKPAECPPDNKLPENSQENLDARLDHAIEETFPTSDPVSVTITKGPEPARADQEARSSSADDQQSRPEQAPIEHVLDQVREALNDVAGSASEAAGNVYSRGRALRPTGTRTVPGGRAVHSRGPASRNPPGDREPVARAVCGRSHWVRAGVVDPWSAARTR